MGEHSAEVQHEVISHWKINLAKNWQEEAIDVVFKEHRADKGIRMKQ